MKHIGKQFISLILVFGMIIAGTGTAFAEQEKNPSLSEQDNHLKTTDLLVYLDETPIHAYSLNDQTLILLNDLKDYGFRVGQSYAGCVFANKTEKKESTFQPVYERDQSGKDCGQIVQEKRVKVFFNGEEIPAYTTDVNKGYTVDDKEYVSVKDLSACTEDGSQSIYKIGSTYDKASKKLWLSTQVYPGAEEEKGYSYWTSADTQDLQKEHLLLTENYAIHYWTEANENMPSIGDLYAFISYKDGAKQVPLKNTFIWNAIGSTRAMLIGSFGGIEYPSFQQDSQTGHVLIFERPGRVFLLNPYTMQAMLQDTVEIETPAFNDVQGHWAEESINRWKDAGFINGYPDGSFQPDEKVTRAEFSKMITMAFDLKESVSVDGYNDLNQSEWYYGYIPYAAKYLPVYPFPSAGRGTWWNTFYENNDGGFLPSTPTLRVHVAEALSRIMEDREEIEVPIPDMRTVTDTLSQIYDDPVLQTGSSAAETEEFASNYERMVDAVWLATKLGIMNGYGNTFEPAGCLTRAEAVTVIDRVLLKNSQDTAGVIADSWDQIIASVNDGSYKKKYHIGDTKALDLGDEGVVDMQIAAFDTDELADGSGHAGITWISKQTLKSEHRMNPMMINSDPSDPSKVQIGTGNAGGWVQSEMRSWLKEKVKPSIPSNVQNAIKPVKKYTTSMDHSNDLELDSVSIEDIWIPSVREVFGNMASYEGSNGLTPYYESTGPIYEEIFNTDKDRMKQKTGTSDESVWWLRSATYKGSVASHSFVDVQSDGSGKLLTDFTAPDKKEGVVICFCM